MRVSKGEIVKRFHRSQSQVYNNWKLMSTRGLSSFTLPCNREVGVLPALHEDTDLLLERRVQEAIASCLHHRPALDVQLRIGVKLLTALLDHVCNILDS